ncbi:hypothetical protein CAPTEDRAFT_211036 [Capitella teleta]|uniref:Glycosyltransferase family 92 protein n=1 Tax=Capitella teleta TaxID=283909 RepID=R7VE77_CAPTE|nr:hypothetical protein CAPTEDRAFT_211036 [Capitella teleta]|eukprot:ELU14601.1 hypothetical protein CAPTEDRAFT_211036 [Capitella teleta]
MTIDCLNPCECNDDSMNLLLFCQCRITIHNCYSKGMYGWHGGGRPAGFESSKLLQIVQRNEGSSLGAFLCRQTVRKILLFSIGICISLILYLTISPFLDVHISHHPVSSFNFTSTLNDHDATVLGRLAKTCVQRREMDSFVRNDVWYVMTNSERRLEVCVFSAFLDDRDEHQMWLRLLSVSNTQPNAVVFCQVWYAGVKHPVVSVAEVLDTGRGADRLGTHHQERLYSCALPVVSLAPRYVSLAFDQCQTATASVTVQRPQVAQDQVSIGVCVAVAYGRIEPRDLVEWIEFNRVLGVGEINVYSSRPNHEAIAVFSHYNQSDILRWQTVFPPVRDSCLWCHKLSTIPVINDCLYRNMHRYRYLAVIDFDEFIIPRNHGNLLEALQGIEKKSGGSQPAIMFRNAYFFLDFPKQESDGDLVSMTHVNRLNPNKAGYAPKSIIDPRKCIIVQNHYCMTRTSDVGPTWTSVASEDEALLHHYKKCHFGRPECEDLLQHPIYDNSTLRFKEKLLPLVKEALDVIHMR